MRRSQQGAALWMALAVILLVGLWAEAWIRSLATASRALAELRAQQAGLDLAESALVVGRTAMEAGKPIPTTRWHGPGGESWVEAAPADQPALALEARAELREPGPLAGVVIYERYHHGERGLIVLGRRIEIIHRP